jgi:hypothetical protein
MRSTICGWQAVVAALAVASCSSDDEVPAFPEALSQADADVAAALYAGTPRTPVGFATDPPPSAYAQVTTYHIKSSQLAAPPATTYELCADDWSAALAWSEELAAQANPYLDLVASDATARYFEFDRVPRGVADQYVRQRVFRCAYLDRGGVNLAAASGPAGVLNAQPLNAAAMRDVAEYLWLFTSYNNAGHAVVASDSVLPGPAHALTIASLERGTSCDRVTLRESLLSGVATGALSLSTSTLRQFGVRQSGGTLVGC